MSVEGKFKVIRETENGKRRKKLTSVGNFVSKSYDSKDLKKKKNRTKIISAFKQNGEKIK